MSWMPPQHDLLSPITGDDGAQIEQIQLKPLFYAAQKKRWSAPVMMKTISSSNWRCSPPACRSRNSTSSNARTM